MAQAPFRSIHSRLASRSIRIMISPTPSTFAERRSILQVLKKYGHVDTFRRENHQANRYISVTGNEATATTLTRLSPIACRISLPRIEPAQRARQLQSLQELAAQPVIEFQTQTTRMNEGEEQPAPPPPVVDAEKPDVEFETREFVLTIGFARDYDHGNAATKATEHAAWPKGWATDRSFAATALGAVLPDTLLRKGLCHWLVRPAPADAARDGVQQRLERKQTMPGQMTMADPVVVMVPRPPRPPRRK
ncbi:hypothetical protein BBO_07330 [Beauveria brongniartii RCEF 3172]|uniref:Uncharacterized protein n=1 Tax=Beauveria brongniartii RCEF 3172 TaxID=1081107 RepID=A0A166ZIF1_9HYPO|nr:hypothetical protein BBO_07330 [Beauveria brongniartii RCEF 3172]